MTLAHKRSFQCIWFLSFLLGQLLLVSCVPPTEQQYEGVALDVKDPLSRKILDFQDQRLADSLVPYFGHENPNYRYLAATAFGSFKDPKAATALVALLQDPYDLVRAAAAYAIGQQGDPQLTAPLLANFRPDTSGGFAESHEAILAAIGKIAPVERLEQLATVTTYLPADTALIAGQAWAIYYFARRKITSEQANIAAFRLSGTNYPQRARYPALAYLARYAPPLPKEQRSEMLAQLATTNDPDLRLLLWSAIGRQADSSAQPLLLQALQEEKDWRAQVNIIRALEQFPYEPAKEAVRQQLRHPNELVAATAANFFLEKGIADDATAYWGWTKNDSLSWQATYTLYQAANRYLPLYFADYRGSINYQLQQRFLKSSNPYEKAAIIAALAEFPWNYRIIQELGFGAQEAAVKTAAAKAIATIGARNDFEEFFKLSSRRVRVELLQLLQKAIETKDPGMIYEAAQALIPKGNPYIGLLADLSWAEQVADALPMPAALEAQRELTKAIQVLAGKEPTTDFPAPAYNNPINWKVIDDAGERPVVRIRTNKGNIDVALWPEVAALSTSSFLSLAQKGFYNGKAFHRVVPNFVVQGGDPRGDGYGATDWCLRTETPRFHWIGSGILGLASAGRDTEGVQFFFTHSGTPHLDGNYTAFGRVVAGQEVVDALRMGDTVERIELR